MPKCNICNDSGFVQGQEVLDVGKNPTKEIIYTTVQPCTCNQQQKVPAKAELHQPEKKQYKQPKTKKKSRGWWDG